MTCLLNMMPAILIWIKKSLPSDGVIIGSGTIYGAPVAIFAQDFTVAGGSLGLMHSRKITKIMDHALKMRMPLIGINDSGGARIQEGVNSLAVMVKYSSATLYRAVLFPSCQLFSAHAQVGQFIRQLLQTLFSLWIIFRNVYHGARGNKDRSGEEISMEDLGGARYIAR